MESIFKKHKFKTALVLVIFLVFTSSVVFAENNTGTIDSIIFEDNGDYFEVELGEWADAYRNGPGDPLYDRFSPDVATIVGIRSGDKYIDFDDYANKYRDNPETALEEAADLPQEIVDEIKPYSLKLEVIEVKEITTTSVDLEVEEVKIDLQGVTVEVINPADEVIAVQGKDVDEGENQIEFQFVEELDVVIAGTWTVEGVPYEVDPNLKVLLKGGKGTVEVDSDFDILKSASVDNEILHDQDYEWEESLLLTAIPDEGYGFHKWTVNGEEYFSKQIILTMTEHKEVEVYFEVDPEHKYKVTFDEDNDVNAQIQVYDSADLGEEDKVGAPVTIDNGSVDKDLGAGNYWFEATADNYKDYEGSFEVVDSDLVVTFEMEELLFNVEDLDGFIQEVILGVYNVTISFSEAEEKLGANTDDVLELIKDDEVVAEFNYREDKNEFLALAVQDNVEEIKAMLVRVK